MPSWDMHDETRAEFARFMDRAVYGNVSASGTVAGLVREMGSAGLIAALESEGVKHATARDSVKRWTTGQRSPNPENRARLERIAAEQRQQARGSARRRLTGKEPFVVELNGKWRISKTVWKGIIHGELTDPEVAPRSLFLSRMTRGNWEGAAHVVADRYFEAPNPISEVLEIYSVTIL